MASLVWTSFVRKGWILSNFLRDRKHRRQELGNRQGYIFCNLYTVRYISLKLYLSIAPIPKNKGDSIHFITS